MKKNKRELVVGGAMLGLLVGVGAGATPLFQVREVPASFRLADNAQKSCGDKKDADEKSDDKKGDEKKCAEGKCAEGACGGKK